MGDVDGGEGEGQGAEGVGEADADGWAADGEMDDLAEGGVVEELRRDGALRLDELLR